MKKLLLVWGITLLGGAGAWAQSPYKGTTVPATIGASADVYLYNVGTGKWLQNNDDNNDTSYDGGMWTTRGELGKRGFDVKLTCLDEQPDGNGYQIDPKFGHNHSMNVSNLYLDTGEGLSTWYFEPADDAEGVENAYRICGLSGVNYYYLGGDEKGWLVKNEDPEALAHDIWQVVTKEERLQYMIDNATPEHGMDATWLIGDPTFAHENERFNQWSCKMSRPGPDDIVHIGDWLGKGGDRDIHANRVLECWSSWTLSVEQTVRNLPNGTYKLGLQGFYREGAAEKRESMRETDEYAYNIWSEGREHHYAKYYANGVQADLMSMFACAQDTKEDLGFFFNALMIDDPMYGDVMESGKWVPNSGESASYIFFHHPDLYQNEPITTSVADGTLTFGVKKDAGVNDDWTLMDNFTLTYYGSKIDVSLVKQGLVTAIANAEALTERSTKALNDMYAEALKNGKALVESSDDANAIAAATTAINDVVAAIKATSYNADLLIKTVALCKNEGITGDDMDLVTYASEYADNANDVNRALDGARMLRRLFHADRHENVFPGNEPEADKNYYLYNVGTGRFFCGGESWGTHGAIGFPGVYVTLLNNLDGFCIDTHIQNNGDEHYLDYDGWCDRNPGKDQKDFAFIPQGNGVYCLQRTNISDEEKAAGKWLLGWRTDNYDAVDSNKEGFDNPYNQWILVTNEDRDALLEKASEENPVDATYKIKMPGFNNREYRLYGGWDNPDTGAWTTHIGGGIFGWHGDTPNGIFDGYDNDEVQVAQTITDLAPGYYILSVKGYYRDCAHGDYYNKLMTGEYEPQPLASLKATTTEGEFSTLLVNIESEVNKAPGFGEYIDGFGWITNHPNHSSEYFRAGLYHNQVLVKVGEDGTMTLGVYKQGERQGGDWVCFDDFRLKYLGEKTPTSIEGITDNETVNDGKIYNIQGVQVKDATQRGIYIKNGKKFVVNK